ncbi:MAG TPA: DUF6064 family protein [Casimicrobiaceae bacterium]|nr:DUF6064 family protein [Casimicrobiaceae bacterium]
MSEWWTYTLSDFLLFSPRTYFRLFERYNAAIWPVQIAGAVLGVIAACRLDRNPRLVLMLLAPCWLWIAWVFHHLHYAQINWAADVFAAAFALQAVMLLVVAFARSPRVDSRTAQVRCVQGFALVVVLGYPLLVFLAERTWTSAEAFGTAPDPTASVTLALLCAVADRSKWLLIVIPALWCIVAVATFLAIAGARPSSA